MQALITANLKLHQRLFFFVLIGGLSALTHLGVVFIAVQQFDIHPLIANLAAFAVAFQVSYQGHKHLTFLHIDNTRQLRLPRYFIVASSGGLLNEGLYFLLLRYTNIPYMPALVCVLGLVAVYSFVASHIWACR